MKITFSARHFEATDKLQEFALKEIEHLKRYFEGTMVGDVVLEENGARKSAEIRLNLLGRTLVASDEGTDFYKIIPKVADKIEKQLKSTKSKVYNK